MRVGTALNQNTAFTVETYGCVAENKGLVDVAEASDACLVVLGDCIEFYLSTAPNQFLRATDNAILLIHGH
jgi:hypothetical protein